MLEYRKYSINSDQKFEIFVLSSFQWLVNNQLRIVGGKILLKRSDFITLTQNSSQHSEIELANISK